MIGELWVTISPFYDSIKKCNSFKKRPVLIIGVADSGDYNVLPISRVTRRQYLDPAYDIPIKQKDCPLLNLTADSYVRVHKQTTVNCSSVTSKIGSLKADYPQLFLEIMTKLQEYNEKLYSEAGI